MYYVKCADVETRRKSGPINFNFQLAQSKRGKESNSNSPARGSDRCRGFLDDDQLRYTPAPPPPPASLVFVSAKMEPKMQQKQFSRNKTI